MRDPFQGPGKPEPLKYVLAGCWSDASLRNTGWCFASPTRLSIFSRLDTTMKQRPRANQGLIPARITPHRPASGGLRLCFAKPCGLGRVCRCMQWETHVPLSAFHAEPVQSLNIGIPPIGRGFSRHGGSFDPMWFWESAKAGFRARLHRLPQLQNLLAVMSSHPMNRPAQGSS